MRLYWVTGGLDNDGSVLFTELVQEKDLQIRIVQILQIVPWVNIREDK